LPESVFYSAPAAPGCVYGKVDNPFPQPDVFPGVHENHPNVLVQFRGDVFECDGDMLEYVLRGWR
jgi:hypothetical protein